MSNTQVNPDIFRRHVRNMVTCNPDHVYLQHSVPDEPACRYTRTLNGNTYPDCLIGHGLFLSGVPVEELAALDQLADSRADAVLSRFGLPMDTVMWATRIQEAQDNSMSWWNALYVADNHVRMIDAATI